MWHYRFETFRGMIARMKRKPVIKVSRTYRTVSTDALIGALFIVLQKSYE